MCSCARQAGPQRPQLQHLPTQRTIMSSKLCRSMLQALGQALATELRLLPPRGRLRPLHLAACSSSIDRAEPASLMKDKQQQLEGVHGLPANGAALLAEAAPPVACTTTTALGQVMAAQANFVRVRVDSLEGGQPGEQPPQRRLLCVVRALLKKMRREVLVGDRVRLVGIDWADGRGMVEGVLPRASQLSEPAVANVDHVLLVFSAAMPTFQAPPATRYLLSAEAASLPVTVAINKADLLSREEVQAVVDQVANWGYRAVAVSVLSGEGLEALTGALQGRVSVVAGPSGAGKSSIINALRLRAAGLNGSVGAMTEPLPGDVSLEEQACGEGQERSERQQNGAQLPAENLQRGQQERPGRSADSAAAMLADLDLQAVGEVSARIGRGKHTTRNVTLLELAPPGSSSSSAGGAGSNAGLVVDTPGFNQPDLAGLESAQLWRHFPEMCRVLEEHSCAFRSCQHLQEPGCAVREAGLERYLLYCEIHAELKAAEELAAQRQSSKKRREGNVRVKARAGGQTGVEARLETKSHRRVSRRSVRQKLSELVKDAEDDDVL